MNIHNMGKVERIYSALQDAQNRLKSIVNFPHMVSVTYGGGPLGIEPTKYVLPELKNYYQNRINDYTNQLMDLGVDLSPLIESNEEEEE